MAGAPPLTTDYDTRDQPTGLPTRRPDNLAPGPVLQGEVLTNRDERRETSHVQTRPRAAELFRSIGTNMFKAAYQRGMNLSCLLERVDPSENYHDGLDALGRLMKVADIRVNSNEERGEYADMCGRFLETEQTRALMMEWAQRIFRRATMPQTRALYASADQPVGSVLFPYVSAAQARYQQIAPTIPLNEIVALTTPIVGDAYRAFYLTQDAPSQRFVRVAQGAEVPVVKLVGADHTVRLHKYGRALDATYEMLRRQRIDLVGLHIARIAIQAEIDRVAAGISVMVAGDGNSGTAATNFNLSALDAAAILPNPTIKAYLTFKLKWLNPYVMTHVLVQSDVGVALQLLNTGTANIPLARIQVPLGLGEFQIINPQLADRVRFGVTADAPASTVLGFDARFALERVVEIGSDITEVDRFISRQTNRIVISVVEGFVTLDPFAVKTLTLTA
jgi:hypothetical protein